MPPLRRNPSDVECGLRRLVDLVSRRAALGRAVTIATAPTGPLMRKIQRHDAVIDEDPAEQRPERRGRSPPR